ncbi:hypothetical protein KIN34_10060 [Cellulomonas sp. DKR-3]|uniref:Uncharacterized protein n=1 Tax=Cellulomonas fulva TaxID=2835530 RepID=A0ABS5TZZ2_9CELL|nr:hypothetical protein [Cellulomonas fulva]MBT0994631.1 hypothetical protein [Cellulomonas fulva]
MTQDPATTPAGGAPFTFEPWARALLRCPVTGAELVDRTDADGSVWLVSTDLGRPLRYPVRDGIPVLLEAEAQPA